jgi:CheY-like chemotaxis protein
MKADLGVILRNSQHLSALIDDVLDLSQIDAGHMALTRERVSINQIIEEATIAVRPLFESKNLTLDQKIDPSLPPVFCDRTRIREVLLNLLSNAGRFTERGGIEICASSQENNVLVSVTDTGPGISPEDRARLFQPFQQLDGTIRQRWGGTGLGLSISKRFIELHDGRMWVESQPGIGSTFSFKIPIDPIPPLEGGVLRWMNPYQTYIERSRPPVLPSEPVRPRVMLVEAGQAATRLLKRHLEEVEFVHVPNLTEAIRQIEEHPIQALLVNSLDVNRVLQELKHDSGLPQGMPTFIFSLPDSSRPVNDLQISNYLVKPIRKADLLAALDRLEQKIETILVVDDDTDALRLLRRMLLSAKRNYQVMRAENGKQALEMIGQMRPDVILMDLMMPEMNGFQFLSLREQDPVLNQIPVILTSARDPNGQPIVSDALTVTYRDGLSVQQLINSIQTMVSMVSGKVPEPGSTHQEALPG